MMQNLEGLMKMAQTMGMMPGSPQDGPGPRITLAILAAVENRDCSCEACGHLRAVTSALKAQLAAPNATAAVSPFAG